MKSTRFRFSLFFPIALIAFAAMPSCSTSTSQHQRKVAGKEKVSEINNEVSREKSSEASDAAAAEVKAQKIAENSPRVTANYEALVHEANLIRDSSYRKAALEILDRPRFSVIDARKAQETEITSELASAGLYQPTSKPPTLFPVHRPMSFIAAPASFWSQHHTYPGGLVFHTLTNLRIGLGIEKSWSKDYGLGALDLDLIRLAVIWHDSAKTMTIAWNGDGTASPSEGDPIANTGAHHIWGVAEAIYREMSPRFVVVLASAHNSALPPDKIQLLGYLRAGAIIAGKPFSAAGLNEDGSDLAEPAPLESFLHHLSDHDFVAAQVTLAFIRAKLDTLTAQNGNPDYWAEDRIFAQHGDIELYEAFLKEGSGALERAVRADKVGALGR
jgi:hypothetical protein